MTCARHMEEAAKTRRETLPMMVDLIRQAGATEFLAYIAEGATVAPELMLAVLELARAEARLPELEAELLEAWEGRHTPAPWVSRPSAEQLASEAASVRGRIFSISAEIARTEEALAKQRAELEAARQRLARLGAKLSDGAG